VHYGKAQDRTTDTRTRTLTVCTLERLTKSTTTRLTMPIAQDHTGGLMVGRLRESCLVLSIEELHMAFLAFHAHGLVMIWVLMVGELLGHQTVSLQAWCSGRSQISWECLRGICLVRLSIIWRLLSNNGIDLEYHDRNTFSASRIHRVDINYHFTRYVGAI
jgi:hypothetical protein